MIRKALLPACICSLLFLLSSCTTETWYKTPSGLTYRLFSSNSKGPASATGCTVKVSYTVKVKDTVSGTTEGGMPVYQAIIPGIVNAYDAMEVFSYGLKEGDSVIIVQRIDSMIKKGLVSSMPKGMKGNDERITYMKVLRVFPPSYTAAGLKSDSLINADKAEDQKKMDMVQEVKGKERVAEFIKQNKINATALDSGIYIQTLQKGAGAFIDTGNYICMQYRLKSLHGHVIDTDMDTSFHHRDTLRYVIGSGTRMSLRVDRVLKNLQKGSKANIYFPTMMAYGSKPPAEGAPPYLDIILEVNVIDVLPKKPD